MQELSCYVYEYLAQTKELKVINSIVKLENEIGYEVTYGDKDKFKNDYLNGRLEFCALPNQEADILSKIQADVTSTGVEALQQSALLNDEKPAEDLQAPEPIDQVVAKKINKSSAIRMKDANKVVDWFLPSQFAEKVAEGWVPTKGENINYPILTKDDKVLYTINVSELGQLFEGGSKILIFDVNKLTDADQFRQMFPDKNYPDYYIVCQDSFVEAPSAPANEESVAEPTPQEMPQIPEGGNVPTV